MEELILPTPYLLQNHFVLFLCPGALVDPCNIVTHQFVVSLLYCALAHDLAMGAELFYDNLNLLVNLELEVFVIQLFQQTLVDVRPHLALAIVALAGISFVVADCRRRWSDHGQPTSTPRHSSCSNGSIQTFSYLLVVLLSHRSILRLELPWLASFRVGLVSRGRTALVLNVVAQVMVLEDGEAVAALLASLSTQWLMILFVMS